MTALTATGGPGTERVTAVTLSSLPVSYASAKDPDRATVAVVDGVGEWPQEARHHLDRGSKATIVVHPEPADLTPLRDAHGTLLVDSLWASNPAVPTAAGLFIPRMPRAALLECRIVLTAGRPQAAALLDAMALIRKLTGPAQEVRTIHVDGRALVVSATSRQLPVRISILRSHAVPSSATVRMLTDDGGVEITVPHPDTARPAVVTLTDPAGTLQLPTLWESGHRATWRRAAAAIGTGSPDLADLEADQLLLDRLAFSSSR